VPVLQLEGVLEVEEGARAEAGGLKEERPFRDGEHRFRACRTPGITARAQKSPKARRGLLPGLKFRAF